MVESLAACEKATKKGIDVELIDLRSLLPIDIETIFQSITKTGRAVIVHEAPRTCGFGAELSALITEKVFLSLEAPVKRVTGYDTPFPYALEHLYLPSPERILSGIEETINY